MKIFIRKFSSVILSVCLIVAVTASATSSVSAAVSKGTTIEDIGADLRESMKLREGDFAFTYKLPLTNNNDAFKNVLDKVMDEAFKYTGNPEEGDYLKYHFAGYDASARINSDGRAKIILKNKYYTTAAQEKTVSDAVNELISQWDLKSKSDYEKAKLIYDFICSSVTYDYDHLTDSEYKLQYTAYAALINGTSVCQGYSNLAYRLALETGLDCRIISGTSEGGAHAWNIIKIGDLYYNIDSTWDSGFSDNTYRYFLKCSYDFPDHARYPEYSTSVFNEKHTMDVNNYNVESPAIVSVDQTSLNKLTPVKKGLKITWKAQNNLINNSHITGYQIRYSKKSNMSSAKKITIKGYKTVTKTITNLTPKARYYVQIRTYKIINGRPYYSKWSKYRYATVKG